MSNNWIEKVSEAILDKQSRILSYRIVKLIVPFILWLAVTIFFYSRMVEKQSYYVKTKAVRMVQNYENLLKSKQTLSDFIINYNEYLSNFKDEVSKFHPNDTTTLNLKYLLLTPAYKQIEINQNVYSTKPLDFGQLALTFNLESKQILNQPYDYEKSAEVTSQDAFLVPLDVFHFRYDTMIISYSVPDIVTELNNLNEEEYFYLPPVDVSGKFEISARIVSSNNHLYKKITPLQSDFISNQINQHAANKHPGNNYFSQRIKLDETYFNSIFVPVYDLNKMFSGYIFTYSLDGYYVFYFKEFLKRTIAASLSLIIIFFLYYRNFDYQKKLRLQNIAIREDQENLKRAKEIAENANLIKSEFLANMSHEIRTPMNTVLGFTEILVNQITDEQHKKYLASISAGTKNLLVLINDILDLSKIEAGKMKVLYEPADPRVIFSEIESIFSEKVKEKSLRFTVDIPDNMPKTLLIDEIRFRQILFNLIGNAIKFTEAGFVKITTKVVNATQNDALIDLVVEVEDSGIGIEQENHEDIFNAFQQQDGRINKKYGGSGLGLSISKKLAQLMDGSISISSIKGKGSIFTLTLRDIEVIDSFTETQSTIPAKNNPLASRYNFHNATILIVDDVEQNRFLIKEFLRKSNISILEATNGKKAVELACLNKPDLILMDIRMPVMDGYEATDILRNNPETAKITIIALTASVMEEEIKKIKSRGFNHFLQKPIKYAELTEALAMFLSHDKETPKNPVTETQQRIELSSNAREHLNEIIELLENNMLKKWEKVKSGGFIDEIANFGNQIKNMGHEYAFESLVTYGLKLIESTESFDVNTMKKTLNAFPGLIDSVKNIARNQGENE